MLAERVGREVKILRLHSAGKNEVTQGRSHFHLHHGHARHAGAGIDRAGPAEAGLEFPRRRYAERGEDVRDFRDGLRADAVSFFANAWRAVGPLRSAARDLVVQSWTRPRLHRDGAGAD